MLGNVGHIGCHQNLQCQTLKNGLSGPGSTLTLAAWDFGLGRKVGSKSMKMRCPKFQESRDQIQILEQKKNENLVAH